MIREFKYQAHQSNLVYALQYEKTHPRHQVQHMRIILLIAILLCAGAARATECAWDPTFVSAAAKPLPPSRFRGIDRSLPVATIIERLGPAARDVGSGLYVLQWHVTDGRTFSVSTASACGKPVDAGFHPARPDPSSKPKPLRGSS